jgi:ribosomal protein L44E
MARSEPVLSGAGAGRTVTYGGGSSAELKLAGEQSGGDWAVVEPAPVPFPGSRGEHAMNVVECTIPSDMTIEQWRRLRRGGVPTRGNPWSLLLAAARRVARHGEQPCDHLHDTASRYDQAAKRLELLLTCPVCKTEKVIHSLAYEPRFEPSGATIHPLRRREGKTLHALDRAA